MIAFEHVQSLQSFISLIDCLEKQWVRVKRLFLESLLFYREIILIITLKCVNTSYNKSI